MNKKIIMQILVVAAALLFITSSFNYLGTSRETGTTLGSENISGVVEFNGTIRTYDPFLLVVDNITTAQIDEIRNMAGVKNIRSDAQGYFIDTETRDDVYPIAKELRASNISTLAVANIAAPTEMQLQFGTQPINVTSQGVVRVATEPLLDAGEDVKVAMIGISNNGYLIDYYSQIIVLESVTLEMDADVLDRNYRTYLYEIPWEDRNIINETGNYQRKDAIIFNTPLDVGQILTKKQFSYVTYIDSYSAQVLPDFQNRSLVEENFQDVDFTLPPSILVSNESVDIPYDYSSTYSYNVSLTAPEGYELSNNVVEVISDSKLKDTIKVNVTAVATGNRIVSVESVTLPS